MAEHQPSPDDSTKTSRMENELLSFEVSFLKGSLAEHQQRAEAAEKRAQRAEAAEKRAQRAEAAEKRAQRAEAAEKRLEQRIEETRKNTIVPDERARLEQAHKDLVLLLNRLSKSPAGRLFRQRPAFRELESRYLE